MGILWRSVFDEEALGERRRGDCELDSWEFA